jgi:hypothetical protein
MMFARPEICHSNNGTDTFCGVKNVNDAKFDVRFDSWSCQLCLIVRSIMAYKYLLVADIMIVSTSFPPPPHYHHQYSLR